MSLYCAPPPWMRWGCSIPKKSWTRHWVLSVSYTHLVDFADLIYNGKWFTPLREALTAFAVDTQKHVTGTVKLKLYKGNIITAAITSPETLYSELSLIHI